MAHDTFKFPASEPIYTSLTCKAGPCDNDNCAVVGRCLYKSSAEEANEITRRATIGKEVEDYKGTVDGGGYKAVMDNPKDPYQLISPVFLHSVAQVLNHGAKKYAANNWMRGMSWTTVYGGILRHLFAWFRGDETDESGMPHLWHAACGIMFLIHYTEDKKYGQFDDRVFLGDE